MIKSLNYKHNNISLYSHAFIHASSLFHARQIRVFLFALLPSLPRMTGHLMKYEDIRRTLLSQ